MGPWVLRVLERIVRGLGLGTFGTWELNVGLFLQYFSESEDIVVRPSLNWLPLEEESPVFLSLGSRFGDYSIFLVKLFHIWCWARLIRGSFSDELNFWFWLSQLIKKSVLISFPNVYVESKWEQGWHFSMPGVGSCNLDSEERKVLRDGLTCPRSYTQWMKEWRVSLHLGAVYKVQVFNITFFQRLIAHLKLGKYYPRDI